MYRTFKSCLLTLLMWMKSGMKILRTASCKTWQLPWLSEAAHELAGLDTDRWWWSPIWRPFYLNKSKVRLQIIITSEIDQYFSKVGPDSTVVKLFRDVQNEAVNVLMKYYGAKFVWLGSKREYDILHSLKPSLLFKRQAIKILRSK